MSAAPPSPEPPARADDPIDAARRRLAAMIVHEARGPLTGALGMAELLVHSDDDLEEATRRELAADVLDGVERIAAVLDDVIIAVFGPNRPVLTGVPLGDALRMGLDGDSGADALAAGLDGAPPVHAEARHVARALAELVANGRLAPRGRGADPVVRWRADATTVTVEVCDAGPAILPEERTAALHRLDRPPGGMRSGRNPGLGVQVAGALAQAMGGSVEIDDGDDGGAVFRLRLPRDPS